MMSAKHMHPFSKEGANRSTREIYRDLIIGALLAAVLILPSLTQGFLAK